jgi:hypothetical protein
VIPTEITISNGEIEIPFCQKCFIEKDWQKIFEKESEIDEC